MLETQYHQLCMDIDTCLWAWSTTRKATTKGKSIPTHKDVNQYGVEVRKRRLTIESKIIYIKVYITIDLLLLTVIVDCMQSSCEADCRVSMINELCGHMK